MREFRIIEGDALEVLRAMPNASVDAVVCDPPYGLGFMGKKWDTPGSFVEREPERGNTFDHVGGNHNPTSAEDAARTRKVEGRKFQEWCEAWGVEAFRVLKSGSRLLAFGGPRTNHRLVSGLEDAGFIIEDSIEYFFGSEGAINEFLESLTPEQRKLFEQILNSLSPEGFLFWLFGQGFPKHKSKLKPAYEPIVIARKGGASHLNIDACRIETDDILTGCGSPPLKYGGENHRPFHNTAEPRGCNQHPAGRWPANVCMDEEAARALDLMSGERKSGGGDKHSKTQDGNIFKGLNPVSGLRDYKADSGGASRFFYCPKADREERNAGLRGMPERPKREVYGDGLNSATKLDPKLHTPQSVAARPLTKNFHPTVKPLALCRWLVRLICAPGGTVLDPFMGSGTIGIAALEEDCDFIGVEREEEYCNIARMRIANAEVNRQPKLYSQATPPLNGTSGTAQLDLLDRDCESSGRG